jgi:hypothetical protein
MTSILSPSAQNKGSYYLLLVHHRLSEIRWFVKFYPDIFDISLEGTGTLTKEIRETNLELYAGYRIMIVG